MSTTVNETWIVGSGCYLPERSLDNFELYEQESIRQAFDVEQARGSLRGMDPEEVAALRPPEVFHQWALQVTGISSRRILDGQGVSTTEMMCAEASRRALADAGMDARDLDLVMAASLTAAEVVPNLACTLGQLLGVPAVGGYVLNAACAGFVYALASGDAFIRSGAARNVLVVTGDTLSTITDYTDPKTAILFADGAGAVVLSSQPGPGRVLAPPYLVADYSPTHLNMSGQSWLPPGSPPAKLSMAGGPHVLRQAIKAMVDVATRALERSPITWDDVDVVIPHQANRRITAGLEKTLKLPKGRVVDTIAEYGNVSASTVPIALDEVLRGRHGTLPERARVVLTAVGGGYTSGAAVLEWISP